MLSTDMEALVKAAVKVSVIVLTHNEERDLPSLLASLSWCDDIHVVDDGSTDRTVEYAISHGAKVKTHPFESFGRQRNWALDNCQLQHPWALFLDADEIATPGFVTAMDRTLRDADEDVAGFYCCWKLMLDGVWLRRCDAFPKWQLRLVARGRAYFTDFGHGQKEGEVNGTLAFLREPYIHHAFSKGWTYWMDRHNRYSSQEARARMRVAVSWKDVFCRNPSKRNKALKPLLSKIPGWPLIRFFVDYVGRGGFLEGRAGLVYCVNMAFYEFLIWLKICEFSEADQAQLVYNPKSNVAETA